ncbi:mechanosensitive ion channel domain-containing protein [Rhodoferax saidenbachensis]|uniref:Small-conductance mechanosensitive channel n=1 Tax=Rhodoferax saidenbachensis TaxID=1484693 RepID=A0ABU1ZSK9_9BURK|nr:mechanosensitive ion channel domain-containing protein [Rhodoferax saidenbachensis]MDR7308388.1 small-conductance mechanosensitive channel [Rhodoferax saidenbachensis]
MNFLYSLCLVALGLVASISPSLADETTKDGASDAALRATTLNFYNRPVFIFRAPLAGVSAADRTKRASDRLKAQLATAGTHHVSQKADAQGVLVQIDGGTTFVVTAADVDVLQQETLNEAAERAAAALQVAIAESQESRNLETMAWALGLSLLASAIVAALVWVLARVHAALSRRLITLSEWHSRKLQLGGIELLNRDRAAAVVRGALTGVYRVLVFVLLYEWLSFVLARFPFTRVWGETLNSYLLDLVSLLGGSVVRAIPGLFTAVVIFYLARAFTGMLDRFFVRIQQGEHTLAWLDADVAVPTRRISKAVVWLFALAMAYPYLPGSETEAFKGLSVLVGLMISLGASNLVGQAASGLILTYGRVFRKGEYVRIADQEGTVTEVGMFATRIRTGLGEELTISNTTILGSTTKNYSRAVKGEGYVLDTTLTIGYDTPWRQVHAMLVEAALRTEGVLADPKPQVFQTALSDWYPVYRLVCQAVPAEPRPRALLLSALHANIQDVFNTYGVQIMSPQYITDPLDAKLVSPDRWFTAPAQPGDTL